jgi:hypothetical protein
MPVPRKGARTSQPGRTAAGRFLRKYGLPGDRHTVASVRCGLHSSFPDCCILFFVQFWSPPLGGGATARRDNYFGLMKQLGAERAGYIPCPSCLVERNLVAVKPCACRRRRSQGARYYPELAGAGGPGPLPRSEDSHNGNHG